jgi:hypothetical protein
VFTARYALSPYIKQIRFVFKGLTKERELQENTMLSYFGNLKLRIVTDKQPYHKGAECCLCRCLKSTRKLTNKLSNESAIGDTILSTLGYAVVKRNS